MHFNFSNNLDFPPTFNLGGEDLEVVNHAKILGIFVNDRLKWDTHVDHVSRKARQRMWALRRLSELKLDYNIIIDFYHKEVRSILEYGAVIFHGGLTKQQSEALESVQRGFFKFLSHSLQIKLSYNEACIFFATDKLVFRRLDLCKTFIKRNKKNPVHSELFKTVNKHYDTRSSPSNLKQHKARTRRFANSPLVFLTRLANQM